MHYKGVNQGVGEEMEIVTQFLEKVLSVLPHSPFSAFLDSMENLPYLSTINYFIPISSFIAIGEAWLASIAIFYLWSIILRWIRAIE